MYRALGNYNPTTPCPGTSGLRGLGCPDCGGTCGGGLGLFDSGLNISGWGMTELLLIGGMGIVALYAFAAPVPHQHSGPTQRKFRSYRRPR